jgi:NADPH:quinone reductase
MKAVRVHQFGGSEQLQVEDIPPLVPGPGEVVVSVKAAGVNPVDTYIRSGTYSLKPTLPYTPGIDGAGVVSQVGLDVDRITPGESVYISRPKTGTYAEECLCAADRVHHLPESTSFVGIPPLAYTCVRLRTAENPGESPSEREDFPQGPSGRCLAHGPHRRAPPLRASFLPEVGRNY